MMRGSFLVASACLAACAAAGVSDSGDMDINVGVEASAFDAAEPEPTARMLVLEAEPGEAAELLTELWTAAEVLPVEKRAALAQPFLALVDLSPERARLQTWETRVGARFDADTRASDTYDTFTSKARALYEADGAGVFLSRARDGAPPFNIGRPDTLSMMAAQTDDAGFAGQIFALMFQLAEADNGQVAFERPALAHGIAEAAMLRCEAATFDRAVGMTHAPDGLRYAFWRARMTGSAAHLGARIAADAEAEDTRYVRQALDGYRAILMHGYCDPAEEPETGPNPA